MPQNQEQELIRLCIVEGERLKKIEIMKDNKNISKLLVNILGVDSVKYELEFDINGYTDIEDLILKSAKNGIKISLNSIERCVDQSYKQQFSFNKDGLKIRLNPGPEITFDNDIRNG